ncbi:MAG TPA: 30S ribosomal protein S7 [Candidatus Lokiarchaeia archaeon]|nr:30S ribosomal protein S7 [Candidatus Lokiarchaeia archaeon]
MARKKKDEEETETVASDEKKDEEKELEVKEGKEKKGKEKKEKKPKEKKVKKGKEETPEEEAPAVEIAKSEVTEPESISIPETPAISAELAPAEKVTEPASVEKAAEAAPVEGTAEKAAKPAPSEGRRPEMHPRSDMRSGRGRRDRRDRDEEIPELHDNFKPEIVTGTGILLFEKWPTDVTIKDKGLQRYLNLRDIGVPHFHGIYTRKRFWKHKQSIVERLANRMMTPGTIRARIKGRRTSYRAGKKQHAINVVRRAFELINLKSGENPVQMLVQAIENASPREDTTRISMGGISYQSSVDVAPARRVDGAIHLLALGASRRSHNSPLTIEECLCEEIIAASKGDSASFAIARKEEKERIAFSAR